MSSSSNRLRNKSGVPTTSVVNVDLNNSSNQQEVQERVSKDVIKVLIIAVVGGVGR